ncbi:MAG: hypothetical protein Q9157_000254 [Trypethelium eluteriae]
MLANTNPPHQRRRPASGPSIPPSPPASPPSHPSYNVVDAFSDRYDLQKPKHPLNSYQRYQINPAVSQTYQKKRMSQDRFLQSQSSWRQENPNAGPDIQQQLQRDVHAAFVIEQQREAYKWVSAAQRLTSVLDLANSPMSVLPRLQPRNPSAPRIRVSTSAPRRIICPSGHQYLESTGYIRSVPIFRPPPDVRRAVPDRSGDRDVGYLYAYHISRSNEETRQAAMERAAWDVNMLQWREGVRSLPVDDRKIGGKLLNRNDPRTNFGLNQIAESTTEPMDTDASGNLLDEPSFGEEAILRGNSPGSSAGTSGHTKRKVDDSNSLSFQSGRSSKRSRSDDTG